MFEVKTLGGDLSCRQHFSDVFQHLISRKINDNFDLKHKTCLFLHKIVSQNKSVVADVYSNLYSLKKLTCVG